MREFEVYLGFDGLEATAHGAYFVQEGLNAADAVVRFVADEGYYRSVSEAEREHGPVREVTAMDGEWDESREVSSASAFLSDGGTWELHVYDSDGGDVVISLPVMNYMGASEAADELGVSRMRVNQLVKEGKLVARNIGGFWAVSCESVRSRLRG